MRRFAAALAFLVVSCTGDALDSTTTATDTTVIPPVTSTSESVEGWQALAAMDLWRSEHPAVVVDGRILVFGGLFESSPGNSGVTGTVESYHPDTDTWTSVSALPQPRHHGMAAVVDGRVLVIGGYDAGGFNPVDTVWELVGEQWVERAPLPEPVGAGAAVVVDGRVFVVGGLPNGGFHSYDPDADAWTTLTPPNVQREHLAAVALDGKVWAIAGRWQGEIFATTEIYHPDTGTWSPGPALGEARSGFGATVIDGAIVVAGGEVFDPNRALDSVERLAPDGDTWEMLDPLLLELHGNPLVSLDGVVYLPGGSTVAAAVDNDGRLFALRP